MPGAIYVTVRMYVFPMPYNRIQIKPKGKMFILFLDQKFHVLSNGVLVFTLSPITCTEKCIWAFTETGIAFNLHFQQQGLNLRENQVHHSKEPKILVSKHH
jgi:hypothetical protein